MFYFLNLLTLLVLVVSSEFSPRFFYLSDITSSRLRKSNARLPGNVLPLNYQLQLQLEEDFYLTNHFSGTVTISINITEQNIQSFQFHSRVQINHLEFTKGNMTVINVTHKGSDPRTDIMSVKRRDDEAFEMGEDYQLTISYNGTLSETSMLGFYKSSYVDSAGNRRYLATTHFEATHARKAFSCFDEPDKKATFEISVTYPQDYHVVSNTKGGTPTSSGNLKTVEFATTPKMSTYLVAFIVSQLNCISTTVVNKKIDIQICSRMEKNSLNVAFEAVPPILTIMEDYTGYKYSDMMDKLTLAAIPDLKPAAMENWGLATFREEYLLWHEGESTNLNKQSVVGIIAHEIAHQWFGNLVTLKWWSDIFLNEGFAEYFQYYVTYIFQPKWELQKQFVFRDLQKALLADSLETALPLSYDLDSADYSTRFDDISYSKGASILRMVHNFLGDTKFKLGISSYISENVYSSSTPEILWKSLDRYAQQLEFSAKLPASMSRVMNSWTTESGYPLLTVNLDGENLIISQEKFLLTGTSKGTEWYVPITYTSSANTDFTNTVTQAWLSPSNDLILTGIMKDVDWIILNNQQIGYYRVNYDDTLLEKIKTALTNNVTSIDELSRSHIVNDQLNLARAGKKSFSEILGFLTFLKDDDSYYSWSSAFRGFKFLLKHITDYTIRRALTTFILEQMKTLKDSVPINQENSRDQIYTLKQTLAMKWACNLGEKNCVTSTKKMFLGYKSDDSSKPSPNLRSIVYCSGLRDSSNVTENFRFLWLKYLNTEISTEKSGILNALGCANSSKIRKHYLEMALTDDHIKRQDAKDVFSSVYTNNPEGVDEVLEFIFNNWKNLVTHFGDTSTLNSLVANVAKMFTKENQLSRLEQFTRNNEISEDTMRLAQSSLENAKRRLAFCRNLENDLKEYFRSNRSSVYKKNPVLSILVTLIGYSLFRQF